MRKATADPKVKKTLVRHPELNHNNINKHKVTRDPGAGSSQSSILHTIKTQELAHPSLCSSEALANYLSEARKFVPPRPLHEEFLDKAVLSAKVTRRLNFHFNDRIYNNLVELNADAADLKKKDRRLKPTIKKDLEPNIDDFCSNDKAKDVIPNIPIVKPKLKAMKSVETGKLHKLVSKFEVL